MRTYLKSQLTQKDFFLLIQALIEKIEDKKDQGMVATLDLDQMKYEKNEIVLQAVHQDAILEFSTIKAFIQEITFSTVFAEDGDYQEITEFLKYMDDTFQCRTVQDIYEFCVDETFEETEEENSQPEKPASQETPKLQGDETGVLDPAFWQRIDQQNARNSAEETNRNVGRANVQPRTLSGDETGVLDASFWEQMKQTSVRNIDERSTKVTSVSANARLLSTKTAMVASIQKDEFWIGKEGCDLIIAKPTVSRKHAVITRNGQHFFVCDNGSTNKTYVRNQEIQERASVEIFNGDKIKFANEEYEFQIIS